MNIFLNIIMQIAPSFAGSFAVAIFYNVERRHLILCGLGGVVGFTAFVNSMPLGEQTATLIGAVAIGLYSEITARIVKVPVTPFITTAIFTIVPGAPAFRTALAIAQNQLSNALSYGIETVFCAGALAVGLLSVSALMRNLKVKRKI